MSDDTSKCAICGERLGEYIDCLESESGKHISEKAAKRFMDRMREMADLRQQRLTRKAQGLPR